MAFFASKKTPLAWVTPGLAVGSAPLSYERLRELHALGVDCIMNLCAEYCDLHWIEADEGFEVYYLPIPDEHAPNERELEKALDWLDEALFLGKRVLIHCRYGLGRTGTVLNAYLLRKGLSHGQAGRTMSGLRSKPQNFTQWWFIRKYGRKSGKLSALSPNLSICRDQACFPLAPYLGAYEAAVEDVDIALLGLAGDDGLCGEGHARCCASPVDCSLVEAVALAETLRLVLGSTERSAATARARPRDGVACPGVCPLSESGVCLLFDFRPLACRLWDVRRLDPDTATRLERSTRQRLSSLSVQLFEALCKREGVRPPESFPLPEIVSGRFFMRLFRSLDACG